MLGLFTSVPGSAIERIIALGMGGGSGSGSSGSGSSGSGSSGTNNASKGNTTKTVESVGNEHPHIFRRAWYAYHNNKSEVGYAENRIRKSTACQFPRSFSRYSTLEADRAAIEQAAGVDGSGSGSGAKERGKASEAKELGGSSSSRDGGGQVNDEIRYLVLCRVAVGKVFVTSKEYRGFPSVGTDPAFDSMYVHSSFTYFPVPSAHPKAT